MIQPVILDNTFYQGMRKELDKNKLIELSKTAKNIREPSIFGTYHDEKHYLETLNLTLASTEETRHRGTFLLREILPRLPNKEKLLDIGPGCGTLTRWIGYNFKHITAVDKNETVIQNLNAAKKIIRKNTHLEKIHDSILNIQLPSNYYDMGIISHVLYYIEQSRWYEAVYKIYNSVKTNGAIVMVLNGEDHGKSSLIKNFGGTPISINFLYELCLLNFKNSMVQLFISNEFFYAMDITTMLHIAGFFLCDAGVTATQKELETYLYKNCLTPNGLFELSTQQKFIVIYK